MWESEGWGGYFYKEQKVSGRPNLLMLFSVEKVELNLPTLAYCAFPVTSYTSLPFPKSSSVSATLFRDNLKGMWAS